MNSLAVQARQIWDAAVAAVRPVDLLERFLQQQPDLRRDWEQSPRLIVVGAGKAGAAMAEALEQQLSPAIDRMQGIINVPSGSVRSLRRLRLHAARPTGSNHPTSDGVIGSEEMLRLLQSADDQTEAICLISGGGSALLPAPWGVSLADKQQMTRLLHACGASIDEMNTVRKHLSRVKGGRLAESFRGRRLTSLILSDVIDDPLDVIASGPTVADPSTFADAWEILDRYGLLGQVLAVDAHLIAGLKGLVPETPKELPSHVYNFLLGNNALALEAAQRQAESQGYQVIKLGSREQGETAEAARRFALQLLHHSPPKPTCFLQGGETTVTLGADAGKGGRNQEYVLAAMMELGESGCRSRALLSGGSDGEDGPTDAAGAFLDPEIWSEIQHQGLDPIASLRRHDAYPFFDRLNRLIRTGLTETNVMDLRVAVVMPES